MKRQFVKKITTTVSVMTAWARSRFLPSPEEAIVLATIAAVQRVAATFFMNATIMRLGRLKESM